MGNQGSLNCINFRFHKEKYSLASRTNPASPFGVPELVEKIFDCLPPGNDLLNCRLVCQTWRSVADSNILKNRTRPISFQFSISEYVHHSYFDPTKLKVPKRSLRELTQLLTSKQATIFPCSSFCFFGGGDALGFPSTQKFLDLHGHVIKSLTLSNLNMFRPPFISTESGAICQLQNSCPLRKLLSTQVPNLECLKFVGNLPAIWVTTWNNSNDDDGHSKLQLQLPYLNMISLSKEIVQEHLKIVQDILNEAGSGLTEIWCYKGEYPQEFFQMLETVRMTQIIRIW